jgi:flagellar basal-body rod protein FlgG
MNGAFYIGATGLHAQQIALDTVANNISNMNTPAFKRSEVHFSELLAASPDLASGAGPIGSMAGVAVDPSSRIFTQGELHQTGQPFDIAIDGEGFIELMGPAGRTELWRGGTLKVNEDGSLATAGGVPLKSMISVPDGATSLSIAPDGVVRVVSPGDGQSREIGRINILRVKDLSQVQSLGNGLYALAQDTAEPTSNVPGEEGCGTLVQGAVETSNVQLSDEMVTLLLMQRAYAASAQLVQAGDQLMSIANNLRRS